MILTYFFLVLSICILWIPKYRNFWIYLYAVSVFFALYFGLIRFFALIPLGALFLVIRKYQKKKRLALDFGIFILGGLFLLHFFPGFYKVFIVNSEVIKKGCAPYSFSLNFDKGSLGLMILSVLPLCHVRKEWKKALFSFLIFTILAVFFLLVLSYFLGYVKWDLKCPSFFPIWIFHNLFLVAIAEEVFFRGFLQKRLSELTHAPYFALIISSILFALMHFKGGGLLILLSFVASLFYGGA